MPFGTDTRMVLVTLYSSGAPVPLEREDMGWQSANRSQVVTDSGMVTKDSPQELSNALSNSTIANPVRLPLPENNMYAAMPPSAK